MCYLSTPPARPLSVYCSSLKVALIHWSKGYPLNNSTRASLAKNCLLISLEL